MPSVEYQESTLNGEATICKYKDRKYFNLKVYRGGKRYTHISLNTEDIEQARINSINAYVKVVSEPPRASKSTMTIARIFEKFMEAKYKDGKKIGDSVEHDEGWAKTFVEGTTKVIEAFKTRQDVVDLYKANSESIGILKDKFPDYKDLLDANIQHHVNKLPPKEDE